MNRTTVWLCSALLFSSCHVKNQLYNPVPRSIIAVPHTFGDTDPNCDPAKTACLAFIEFDDMGEFWDRNKPDAGAPQPGGLDTRRLEPRQLTKALELIRRAKAAGDTPLIVTFVHGWKNNAEEHTGNVLGFEGALEYLKMKYGSVPIVGIYIGWRGDLVSKYWPIRRQLSYFNREDAAIRIPGASMTETFTRIMSESHSGKPGAQVIMVGHSFGGLVLERALTQAMTAYVLRRSGRIAETSGQPLRATASVAARRQDAAEARIWADLVVFVNSAAAASEGKQMLNLLKELNVCYSANRADDLPECADQRPLLLSISSLGDAATRFGLPIGHGPSFLSRQFKGSWRSYMPADPPEIRSQSAYYVSTTAHMEALQSHMIIEVKDPDHTIPASDCARPFGARFSTTTKQTYRICERPGRWNDTPYWVMQMPATVVPDHSGIFNENFVRLLQQFLPSSVEMQNQSLRPGLLPK